MCGIAGIINGGSPDALARMARMLAHRGPDDQGVKWFSGRHSGLAHRRLSIIDLSSAGHQPMRNHDGNRWITYNGEIYNYLELRQELAGRGHQFISHSDTEVILAAYDEWGADCVRRFNGMFAFGIYDSQRHELFVARDHLGIKPFYYAQQNDTFVFSSEAKAILALDGFEKRIDPDAVVSTLLRLWVPEPKTGYEGIWKLLPGHYAFFRDGKFTVSEYWDIPIGFDPEPERPESAYVEELRHLLEQAVRRQMLADVPVGAFLSGGLDSSLIVALMRKVNPSAEISSYTIGFTDRDQRMEAMPDDAYYARRVAARFETDHHEISLDPDINELLPKILWHLDDPVADGASINTYLIASAAREKGTIVLLNGMGGDEVFAGYRKQLSVLIGQQYRRVPGFLRKYLIEPVIDALPVEIVGRGLRYVRWAKFFLAANSGTPLDSFISGFTFLSEKDIGSALVDGLGAGPFRDLYPIRRYYELAQKVSHLPLVDQMTYLDTKLFLPGLNLLYSDKACMAASVESRPPLIDVDIVEFAARLPAKYKIHGRIQKYLLKKAAEAYLPEEIIYRPKAAFGTPLRAWMKSGLDQAVRARFQDTAAVHNRWLRYDYPLRILAEHQSGRSDNAHLLWGVFVLANWLDGHGANAGESRPMQ
jgi:asparagine synthase (glutamine-hydrolysing)